jgi:hypothetical protein
VLKQPAGLVPLENELVGCEEDSYKTTSERKSQTTHSEPTVVNTSTKIHAYLNQKRELKTSRTREYYLLIKA